MPSQFSKSTKPIKTRIVRGAWLNARKMWGHPLHRICSRVGSLPPRIAHYLIMKYSDPGDTVYDPFSGKGTVPLQSCMDGRCGIGNDVSTEAFVVTRALTNPPRLPYFLSYAAKMRSEAERISDNQIDDDLGNTDLRTFYERDTLKQILRLRKTFLEKPRWGKCDFFLTAIALGLLHGSSKLHFSIPCSHTYSMSPRYVRKYVSRYNDEHPNSSRFSYVRKDIWESIIKRARSKLGVPLPTDFFPGRSLNLDAEKATLKLLREERKVDLILTSPPYFDAQTYAWDNWLRLWFLGKDYREISKKLFKTSSKRTYLDRMMSYLDGFYDVLERGSACFVIVGDVKRNGEVINTAKEIANKTIESNTGFTVENIMRDEIPKGRKTLTYVNGDDGVRYERILQLHKGEVRRRANRVEWNKGLQV